MQFQLVKPALLLNTADFESVFSGDSPATKHFECIGLPGTVVEFVQDLGQVFAVRWPFYSSELLYVDKRFGKLGSFEQTARQMPPKHTLLERMEKHLGAPYVWGGNWGAGIPEMLEYYPPKQLLSSRALELWTLRGLDCSGLLFEASNGTTPRNSSQLLHFGNAVSRAEALETWQPMDMIVYPGHIGRPGHVLFVRDRETIIESKSPFGVRICPLQVRLEEILSERAWVDTWSSETDPAYSFMVRRF